MSDVTIQICDFKTKSKSAGKLIDKPSMEKVINSEKFKTSLKMGRILGLATHKSRYEVADPNIPMEDQILTSPFLANCARKIWIDNSKDALMGEFDLLNTTYGNLIKDMLKKHIMIPVSMSVSATADSEKYYIDDLLGVDFTERPDLNASIQKVNFSEADLSDVTYDKDGKHYISFSSMLTEDTCTISDTEEEEEEISCCPECGKPDTECQCVAPGIKREGRSYSQSNLKRPTVTPAEKVDIEKVKPVVNTAVPEDNPVVTNLDAGEVGGTTTECIEQNFAAIPLFADMGIVNGIDVNATMDKIHKDIIPEDQLSLKDLAELDNKIVKEIHYSVQNNFSFIDQYVKELSFKPDVVLRKRINELIQKCRSLTQEKIDAQAESYKSYIDSYILSWLNTTIESGKEVNIGVSLKMAWFGVSPRKLLQLNKIIKRIRPTLAKTGFIPRAYQIELDNAFTGIMNDLYAFINKKIEPKVLYGRETKEESKDGKDKRKITA